MFEINMPIAPAGCYDCASCGAKSKDIRSIRVFQTVMRDGRMYRITNSAPQVDLCRDCREKLAKMLLADARNDKRNEKRRENRKKKKEQEPAAGQKEEGNNGKEI